MAVVIELVTMILLIPTDSVGFDVSAMRLDARHNVSCYLDVRQLRNLSKLVEVMVESALSHLISRNGTAL